MHNQLQPSNHNKHKPAAATAETETKTAAKTETETKTEKLSILNWKNLVKKFFFSYFFKIREDI